VRASTAPFLAALIGTLAVAGAAGCDDAGPGPNKQPSVKKSVPLVQETPEVDLVETGRKAFHEPLPGASISCSTCHATAADAALPDFLPGHPMRGILNRPTFWTDEKPSIPNSGPQSVIDAANLSIRRYVPGARDLELDSLTAKALLAYFASLTPEGEATAVGPYSVGAAPSWDEVNPADGNRGAELFKKSCATCHHENPKPTELGMPGLLKDDFDMEAGWQTVRLGRTEDEPMPRYASDSIPDQALRDILNYLTRLEPLAPE
jgi:mono/diheme cytochrome c family protein